MNEHCKCDGPGFCDRHKMAKSDREYQLCRGLANSADCGRKYWIAWETGKLGATAPESPVTDPDGFCSKAIGFGGRVSRSIEALTAGLVKPCGGCKARAALLNHWLPSRLLPAVEPMEFGEHVVRNCTYHIWPVRGGAWQWNCDQLLQRASLFTGKRIVAIVTSADAEPAEVVMDYMRGFATEFIVLRNDRQLREVTTFVPMLERLEEGGVNEVTFCCHSKGVRHKVAVDDEGSTLFRWAAAQYETCLDHWDLVAEQLRTKAMTGSFKRHGMFATRGNNKWHYSGTFYWFRNHDVFQRNWRYVDQKFFGTESWPGHMFKADETGCLFFDNVGDLYNKAYWESEVQPALDLWRRERMEARQPA